MDGKDYHPKRYLFSLPFEIITVNLTLVTHLIFRNRAGLTP